MLEKQDMEAALKRTATEASKLLLLNPEGNLKKVCVCACLVARLLFACLLA
jgi:hypothetical protein